MSKGSSTVVSIRILISKDSNPRAAFVTRLLRDKSSIIHTQKQEEVKIISICGQHFTIMNYPPIRINNITIN